MKCKSNKEAISNREGMILPCFVLRSFFYRHVCRVEHILDENSVAAFGVVDEHVGDRADKLAVLNDR